MKTRLNKIVDSYMSKVQGVEEHCTRCLKTERWGGSVVLMVVDAAFTSIGLNYFTSVVPKVEEFNKKFIESGKIKNLKVLSLVDPFKFEGIWKNKRSWSAAKEIANYLSSLKDDDRQSLREWAKKARLEDWSNDPVGSINGVGVNTFQYLRMMGGVDTVMPDKIVKRVINEILENAGEKPVKNDILFVEKVEKMSSECGYRPIEICWMTWLIQPEGKIMRMKKYSDTLHKI